MSDYRFIKTYSLANWILFAVGMVMVGVTSHSYLALVGAWIASLHITREENGPVSLL